MEAFAQGFEEKSFFPSKVHLEALARLDYAVRSGMQFAVLTGELGSGKTYVWKMLARRMPRDRYAFVPFSYPPRRFGEVLTEALRTLGRALEGKSSWKLIERALLSLGRARRKAILVFDEAQELPSEFLLELRNMTSLSPGSLTILLVGQPELRARLKGLPPVNSRVGLRYHLRCLSSEEVAPYVRHKLSTSAVRAEFDDASCAALPRHASGSPREINFLAGLALERARADGRNVVTREDVEAVAADTALQAG